MDTHVRTVKGTLCQPSFKDGVWPFDTCINNLLILGWSERNMGFLKGKYHFKAQKCLSVSRNREIIVKFVINYHPSAIKLLISASGQRQSSSVWIEI